MPQYIVKTVRDRNLVIEADYYLYNTAGYAYEFFKKDEEAESGHHSNLKVATVPSSPEILAIIETDAEKADFYDVYDLNTEEEYETRLDEFVGSDTFFDAVSNVIDTYLSPEAEQPSFPVPQTPTAIPDQVNEYPIQHWKDKTGQPWYGFFTPKGFVYFSEKEYAEDGRLSQINGKVTNWSYLDLTGATRLED